MTIDHFTVHSFFSHAPQAILNSAGAVEYEKMKGISGDLPKNREITKDILYIAYKLAEAMAQDATDEKKLDQTEFNRELTDLRDKINSYLEH